jgi:hypothetical protein
MCDNLGVQGHKLIKQRNVGGGEKGRARKGGCEKNRLFPSDTKSNIIAGTYLRMEQ